MTGRVAVVTGSNRGIGLAIVTKLCQVFDGNVLLTARDADKGAAIAEKLAQDGLPCKFFPLDITSKPSIESLKKHLMDTYGGIDVLVNNAAIVFKVASTVPFGEQAETTIATNFFGTYLMCMEMKTILKPNSRLVNISSALGKLSQVSEELQAKFASPTCTDEDICQLAQQFVSDAKEGMHKERGWSSMAYGISKLAVIAYTKVLAREMAASGPGGALINACCPGWVRTDMGGPKAIYSPEEGADTPVYLAMLPAGTREPHGEFVGNRNVKDWMTG